MNNEPTLQSATHEELLDELKSRLGLTSVADSQAEQNDETTDSQKEEANKPAKPEGKRVVRTRGSGDRVYMLDENKKSRQWVYNPEVLGSLGFEMTDVTEVEDNELLKYAMGPAILKAVERDDAGTQA